MLKTFFNVFYLQINVLNIYGFEYKIKLAFHLQHKTATLASLTYALGGLGFGP